jgi:hypothetical protein
MGKQAIRRRSEGAGKREMSVDVAEAKAHADIRYMISDVTVEADGLCVIRQEGGYLPGRRKGLRRHT